MTISDDERIERATLLFEHQKEQYESSIEGYRRLEDKLQKLFASLSVIFSLVILIVRNWWVDLFPEKTTSLHHISWCLLSLFLFFAILSWRFTLSGMRGRVLERPDSSNVLVKVFMENERDTLLVNYAKEYSRLTDVIDVLHASKVKTMNRCSESMHWGAWSFVAFLFFLFLIKINS